MESSKMRTPYFFHLGAVALPVRSIGSFPYGPIPKHTVFDVKQLFFSIILFFQPMDGAL